MSDRPEYLENGDPTLLEILRNFEKAYPIEIFPEPTTRCTDAGAALVMREMAVPWLSKAADEIERLQAALLEALDSVAFHKDNRIREEFCGIHEKYRHLLGERTNNE